jgi:hypothetical protein
MLSVMDARSFAGRSTRRFLDTPSIDQRTPSSTRGPSYSDCGRMMRLAHRCSIAWAIQPLTRLMANVGVNGHLEPQAVQQERRGELDVVWSRRPGLYSSSSLIAVASAARASR